MINPENYMKSRKMGSAISMSIIVDKANYIYASLAMPHGTCNIPALFYVYFLKEHNQIKRNPVVVWGRASASQEE